MTMKRLLQCVLMLLALGVTGCWPLSGSNANKAESSRDKNANKATRNANTTPSGAREAREPVDSTQANTNVQQPVQAQTSPVETANNNRDGATNVRETSSAGWFSWDWLWIALYVAGGLFVLSLLAVGVQALRKQSQQNFQNNLVRMAEAQRSAIREAHKDLDDKLTALATAQKDLSRDLVEVHTEVRAVARLVRESSSDRNDHRRQTPVNNYQPQWEDTPVKDEPEFPVSADDYLRKMDRYANIVKPDFQNGILVSDPEGKGELMLIRDARLADEAQPLFVVPCATHFQTKQDFYTHYEKYYECTRPMAGAVWILGPAVVEKVTGGWRLREKGMLEIRS